MPLQKSYSERFGSSKNRQPWQRSHSHPVNAQSTSSSRPLKPISEVTKKKLSKFQYQPREDESTSEGAGEPTGARPPTMADDAVTPLTRLNWRDLLEPDAPTSAEKDSNASPNDKIMWNNKEDSLYASALSPMLARRRKRARSSSPISSPSADKPETPAVNVGKLREALKKSSCADPTLELWDRYSLGGPVNAASPAGAAAVNPVLEQLMISSSPKPCKDATTPRGGGGNLRRALSCGLNWPKRRRISVASQGNSQQQELEAASKTSLVTALLDSATHTLMEDSNHEEDSPQNTTPHHENMEENTETPSPSKKRRGAAEQSSPCRAVAGAVPAASPVLSDYGDDEFDDDTFTELEASMVMGDTTVPKSAPRDADPTICQDADDEFENVFDSDVDLDAVELAATQSVQQRACSPRNAETRPISGTSFDSDDRRNRDDFDDSERGVYDREKAIQRFLVSNVLEDVYVDEYGHSQPEKLLVIQADGSKAIRTLSLRGAWFDTPAHAKSYVHVIGKFSNGKCIIDDAQNLIILHPDQLISATVVADSFGCMRRAVLQDRVKATSEASPPLVYGTMLHEIFQEALLANKWDLGFLAKVIERTAEKHIEDLYTIKVGLPTAIEHLQSKMTELSYWAKAFVSSTPKADAKVEDRNGKSVNIAITKLLDVEEHVWSPMYGLKGNIDATVEAVVLEGNKKRTLTVPFELKTGKFVNSSHMAQTALYTLLLSDRYDIDIVCGILYYMETSKTMRIPAIRHELRHMIMQRNQLACYIRERSVQLPPMLKSQHMCGKCYAKTSCFVYHKLADNGDGETSGMKQTFDDLVKHLTPTHQEFFIKWENLLTMEEKDSQKWKRELWTMTSVEREKKSRCFADVVIEEGSASVDDESSRINRFHYTFIKRVQQAGFSFRESELAVGEPIVVSDEDGHYALAIGYVTSVRKHRIKVAVDRRLHNARIRQPGFDETDNQVFASIMQVAPEGSSADQGKRKIQEPPIRYRLDKDEFSNGMATVRNNLLQLMANDVPAAAQMRRLVVDLAAPRFKDVPTQYNIEDRDGLNVDQKRAIEKVMSAQDYALVLGMPGTGKTTTIAHIIRALTSQGKTVLLTSHTHTAVDNILLKLKADKIPILRLGAPAKVHSEVRDFVHLAGQPKKTFAEIKEAWHDTPVVATTCLGINHQVFLERSFDYCIVDEASQITLPICAGPIRMARTFVLVGDHNQLPPVVRNEEAREGGLDVSLFKLLSDTHPQSVVNLEHQYRMCEDIMTLSNTLIYEGKLRCGYEGLRERKLEIPNMAALRSVHYDRASLMLPGTPRSFCPGPAPTRCWLYDLLEGEARVRFINTDTIRPIVREEAHGKRIVNSSEVRIVAQLVESLLAVGIPASEIGVMTHYRAQLSLLKERLKAGVEMHTTDRFQGRDKEVIVLSLVRSNEACNIGDLLKDWRRINVAFTRAKTKLLVVGSRGTLKHSGEQQGGASASAVNMLSRFVALMEARDWVYDLPADALSSHPCEEVCASTAGATQHRSPPKESPKRPAASGKENWGPKRARVGEGVLLKGKVITRDILNEMTDGVY